MEDFTTEALRALRNAENRGWEKGRMEKWNGGMVEEWKNGKFYHGGTEGTEKRREEGMGERESGRIEWWKNGMVEC